jgi:hypothetical protein
MSPSTAPTPPPSRRGQRGAARLVAGRRRRGAGGLVGSTVARESFHHFHQFSGMHGEAWCWTDDIPVNLCPVSGQVDAESDRSLDPGARR